MIPGFDPKPGDPFLVEVKAYSEDEILDLLNLDRASNVSFEAGDRPNAEAAVLRIYYEGRFENLPDSRPQGYEIHGPDAALIWRYYREQRKRCIYRVDRSDD